MLKFYSLQKKMYLALQIIVSVFQIILFLTIFSVSLYWFFELLNLHIIDFMQPVADFVRGFIKLFYKRMIEVNGVSVDGSILLFDIIALILIFVLSQLNAFFKKEINKIDIIFDKQVSDEEAAFNKQLQTDYESSILKNHNIGILVSYSLKNIMGNSFWENNTQEYSSNADVDKQIYLLLSKLPGCKVSKSGSQFLLLHNDFEKADFLLYYVNALFAQIDEYVLKRQLSLTTYAAIHPFDDETDVKEVFTLLNRLLSLKIPDEIVCIGEFKLRYEFLKEKKCAIQIMGDYFLPPDIKVMSIVKKN